MTTNESKLIQQPATFAADQDASRRATDAVITHRRHRPCLNHNETVLTTRSGGRGLQLNHNETVLAVRSGRRGLHMNHNETVLSAG